MSTYAKLNTFAAIVLSLIIAALFFSGPAMAAKKKPTYSPCKEDVRVVGDARPGHSWADSAVTKQWKKEVASRFGASFAQVENAKNLRQRCYDGPLKTTRCEMIARPCEVQF